VRATARSALAVPKGNVCPIHQRADGRLSPLRRLVSGLAVPNRPVCGRLTKKALAGLGEGFWGAARAGDGHSRGRWRRPDR
jgi:hypothetical protein